MKGRPYATAGALCLLLATASLLAGCLGGSDGRPEAGAPVRRVPPTTAYEFASIAANLTQPQFGGSPIFEEHWVTSFDGTELRLRVHRPDAPEDWRAPVIVQMSPYFALEPIASDPLTGWLVEYFVPRGYAVVLSDVRGSGESGGCLEHTGRNEARDGYEVVEYLAALSWTNARVGMIGLSYDAETQQATLTTAPPHLATIIPAASISSLYDHVYFDAVPYREVGLVGAVSYTAQGMLPPSTPLLHPGGRPNPHSPGVYAERPACHVENVRHRSDPAGDYNAYWADRDLRARIGDVGTTSVLYVHGLQDWNVKPIHIAGWYNELPWPKHAWIGQWGHDWPTAVGREDWQFTIHRWLDHWLMMIDTGIMDEPPVQVQDSTGAWRTEDTWPPERAETRVWYLSHGGQLTSQPYPGAASYADNGLSMESQDGESVEWTSEPLDEEIHYAGLPRLTIHATLSSQVPGGPAAPGTHFVAHLVDVAPDGTETVINRGYLDARHRETLNETRPVANDIEIAYSIRFFPQDDVVPAGHSLRLRLGAVDDWVQPDGTNARVTLRLGGEEAARLVLPLVGTAHTALEPGRPTA